MESEDSVSGTDRLLAADKETAVGCRAPTPDTAHVDDVDDQARCKAQGHGSRLEMYIVIAPFVAALIFLVALLIAFELGAREHALAFALLPVLAIAVILVARHLHLSRRLPD